MQMLDMFLSILTKDKNVVHIDNHALAKERGEDFIHDSLEGSWGISQPKRQYLKLEIATKLFSANRHSLFGFTTVDWPFCDGLRAWEPCAGE